MSILIDEELDLDKIILEAEQLVERRKPESLALVQRAMSLALQTNNPRHIAYANYILAFYYCLVANDYDQSIELCNKALKDVDEEDISGVVYKIYMALGNSYQLQGDVFSAYDNYLKGLKLLETREELNSREKGFAGSFYYNVSLLLIAEQNSTAEQYLLKAIDIYKELGNGWKLSKSYIAYAGVLENREEFAGAIEYLFKALEIDQQLNDPYSIALSKANLCILHLRIDKPTEALSFLNDSLTYFGDNHMVYETAKTKLILGETLFAIGRCKEGIDELIAAEELFHKLENKKDLSEIYKTLGGLFSKIGDFEKAWEYLHKHNDSLKYFFNIERERAVTRARKEFETEQRDKETLLLKTKNEEIQVYVRKLEVSNNELKQFAHVASHDLREPLRMVNSYMDLLKRSLGGSITDEQKEFIGFAINGAKRMDHLIIDLLRLAKVDSNPRIANIKLRNIFNEIALNLDTLIKGRNALIIVPEHLPELMADRTQILLLLQNLIANGIKYNTSFQPVIKIKCAIRKNSFEISVADNGIGIAEQYRTKVFEIFQRIDVTKDSSGSGIGLTIAKKIVDSMGGVIRIEDNKPAGSIFVISLPPTIIKDPDQDNEKA